MGKSKGFYVITKLFTCFGLENNNIIQLSW